MERANLLYFVERKSHAIYEVSDYVNQFTIRGYLRDVHAMLCYDDLAVTSFVRGLFPKYIGIMTPR